MHVTIVRVVLFLGQSVMKGKNSLKNNLSVFYYDTKPFFINIKSAKKSCFYLYTSG